MVVNVDPRRKRKLVVWQMILELCEKYDMPFHRSLAVLDVVGSFLSVTGSHGHLAVPFGGGCGNLCAKFLSQFLGIHTTISMPARGQLASLGRANFI